MTDLRVIGFQNVAMGIGVAGAAFTPPPGTRFVAMGRDQQASQAISYRFNLPTDGTNDGQDMDVFMALNTLMPIIFPCPAHVAGCTHEVRRSVTAAASTISILFLG